MIVVKLISGLGNQLFQYSIGRQLSILNNVPLKLDTSFYKNQNLRSYKLDKYNITSEIATEQEVDSYLKKYYEKTFYAKIFRNIELYLPKSKRLRFKEEELWVFEPQLFNKINNTYIDGYWQHYQYFEKFDPSIFQELTLKEICNTNIKNTTSIIASDLPSISVHIRRGDYISDPDANKLMGILPLEYYNKAIKYIIQNVKNPSFYFFSDDLEWVKKNIKIDYPVYYIEGNPDYIDLELMRKCHHNIIANSSFSWWGAFLNRNPNKIVIAPKQWVLPDNINKKIHIQFPEWIKL